MKTTFFTYFIVFIGISVYGLDFKPYSTIDSTTKAFLISNRHARADSFTAGNVTLFGNSITYTQAFWSPFQWGTPGPVPGTNAGTYGVRNCAYSGWKITDGLGCVASACRSERPEVCIVEFGTNDIDCCWSSITNGTFGTNYRWFLDTVLSYGCIPVVSTIPPVRRAGVDTALCDLRTLAVNDTIRRIAASKHAVLVDCWKAFMDYTLNNPWSDKWFGDHWVHPSGGTAITDTANPGCGYGIRNAVTWQAVNKVYRQIIDVDTSGGKIVIPTDSVDVPVSQDAWLSGCCGEEGVAFGANNRSWMRLKGSDNGQMALQFNMDKVLSDTSAILGGIAFVRPIASSSSLNFRYSGLTEGITSAWDENTITYTIASPRTVPVGSQSISYNGAPGTAFHLFPVSAKLVKGMKVGTYSGLVIKDIGGFNVNQDFATKEAGAGFVPYLRVYFNRLETKVVGNAASHGSPYLFFSPNPFNHKIKIVMINNLSELAIADVRIFSMSGKQVCKLTTNFRQLATGVIWDVSNQTSGVYIVKVTAGKTVQSGKLVLQK